MASDIYGIKISIFIIRNGTLLLHKLCSFTPMSFEENEGTKRVSLIMSTIFQIALVFAFSLVIQGLLSLL
jgi:hypothetical protein